MIEEFKKYLIYKKYLSSRTVDVYLSHVKEFIAWNSMVTHEDILKLNKHVVKEYKDYLIFIKNNKIQTINSKISALSMFNKFLWYSDISKNYIYPKNIIKSKYKVL